MTAHTLYLFYDKKTNQSFIVEDKNEREARFVAEAYYSAPVLQRTVNSHDIEHSELALLKRY